jgi:hypothetical protein
MRLEGVLTEIERNSRYQNVKGGCLWIWQYERYQNLPTFGNSFVNSSQGDGVKQIELCGEENM